MKKIILPTDFSENAYNAIKYAVQLFKDEETTFYLIHSYTPPVFQVEYVLQSPSQTGLEDSYKMRAMKQLEELKKRLLEEFQNTRHTFVIWADFNTLTDEILLRTKNEKADLVIMGTQGATNTREILFGTNTTQVINKSICPVIAVPSNFEYVAPKGILFPTDYEIDYKKERLQQLLNISKKHKSKIDVIHVSTGRDLSDEQAANKQKLEELLSHTNNSFHELPSKGIIEGINQYQTENAMNLLVMARNKRTFFERLFVEPVIKSIGFHIDIPFMVIPYSK
jgi:nucleotide-binding universal stress UspA family protein